jgi:hypothetical protein
MATKSLPLPILTSLKPLPRPPQKSRCRAFPLPVGACNVRVYRHAINDPLAINDALIAMNDALIEK